MTLLAMFLLGLIIGFCAGVHCVHAEVKDNIKAGHLTEDGKAYKITEIP